MNESQQTEGMATAEELRAAARSLEEAVSILADLAETPLPLEGDAKAFPRPAPEDRRLVEGLEILEADSGRAIATLRALAAARERRLDLPPILFAPIQPYLVVLRAAGAGSTPREPGRGPREGAADEPPGPREGAR